MWWKTHKDYLIESLQSDLAWERRERAEIQSKYDALLVKLQERAKVEVTAATQQKPPVRSLRAYCDNLSERSRKLAVSKGRKLIAEIPPPGVKVAGA
jgi:hypothetical protein